MRARVESWELRVRVESERLAMIFTQRGVQGKGSRVIRNKKGE